MTKFNFQTLDKDKKEPKEVVETIIQEGEKLGFTEDEALDIAVKVLKKPKTTPKRFGSEPTEVITEVSETEEMVMTIEEPPTKQQPLAIHTQNQIQDVTNLPSVNEVDAFLAMYNHVKKSIVDQSDFHTYQGKPRMKKSGWRKFIKPFNLSVELIREEDLGKENPHVYEKHIGPDGNPDIHAEVWVKVSVTHVNCPNCKLEIKGQFIEAVGLKSKSEYWSKDWTNFGSYNLHNLITTARTRAENAGISDLVGFGEVSYEEVYNESQDKSPIPEFKPAPRKF